MNILAIRTHYPQWASKSGINQYFRYLNPEGFKIAEHLVPLGDQMFPVRLQRVKDGVRGWIQRGPNKIYDLNDYWAELTALAKVWFTRYGIVQYCDPEHTLQYLPGWIRATRMTKNRAPTFLGMFHQPTSILKTIMSPDLCRCLDHIVLMSAEQKGFFSDVYPEDRMSVILHGVDIDYYQPDYGKREIGIYKCLTVGHWLRDYDVLAKVAEHFAEDATLEFHAVTGKELQCAPRNVVFHRNISDNDLLHLYQSCHLLFMPLTDATANNAIMEGMGCGLPVLTTDLPATREYLEGADAILVKNNSVPDFVGNISTLRRRSDRRTLGDRSRRRAVALSWHNVAREYEVLYRYLADKWG